MLLEKDAATTPQLNELVDAVEEGLRKALVDGAPEARLMGRRAFTAFSLRWEDRGQRCAFFRLLLLALLLSW